MSYYIDDESMENPLFYIPTYKYSDLISLDVHNTYLFDTVFRSNGCIHGNLRIPSKYRLILLVYAGQLINMYSLSHDKVNDVINNPDNQLILYDDLIAPLLDDWHFDACEDPEIDARTLVFKHLEMYFKVNIVVYSNLTNIDTLTVDYETSNKIYDSTVYLYCRIRSNTRRWNKRSGSIEYEPYYKLIHDLDSFKYYACLSTVVPVHIQEEIDMELERNKTFDIDSVECDEFGEFEFIVQE